MPARSRWIKQGTSIRVRRKEHGFRGSGIPALSRNDLEIFKKSRLSVADSGITRQGSVRIDGKLLSNKEARLIARSLRIAYAAPSAKNVALPTTIRLSPAAREVLKSGLQAVEGKGAGDRRAVLRGKESGGLKREPFADSLISSHATQAAGKRIGPFYSDESLSKLLNIPLNKVSQWARDEGVLAVRTKENVTIYPSFQFRGAELRREYFEVIKEFHGCDVNPWAIADWFTLPQSVLEQMTPNEWIAANRSIDSLRDAAREYAWRWTQP